MIQNKRVGVLVGATIISILVVWILYEIFYWFVGKCLDFKDSITRHMGGGK